MADLAQSAVTINRSWTEGGLASKDRRCAIVTLVLTGQGTVANAIPASLFGMSVIEEASSVVSDGNDVVARATPSYDGSQLLLAVDGADTPADVTDTVKLTVKGY